MMEQPTKKSALKKNALANDPRFAKARTDPRYRAIPKKTAKFKLDPRFARMLKDPSFGSQRKVDKYGRPITDPSKEDLSRLYTIEEEDEKAKTKKLQRKTVKSEEEASEEQVEKAEEAVKVEESERSESESDSAKKEDSEISEESSEESSKESLESEEDTGSSLIPKDEIPMVEETARLAAVNLDWDHVKSFCPSTGAVRSVTIYPSKFGLERMQQEAVQGPPKEIWSQHDQNTDRTAKGKRKGGRAHVEDDQTGEGSAFSPVKLREYELSKLRYYYAIVECDSKETALAIYNNCDGLELERTSNIIDLRFVPDEHVFTQEPKDRATDVPPNYKPLDFFTRALQHTRLELTWDSDDSSRISITTAASKWGKEVDEDAFQAFLASDDEDEDEDAEEDESAYPFSQAASAEAEAPSSPSASKSKKVSKIREKYQKLLQEIQPPEEQEEVEDLEITFIPGLSETAEKLVREKQQEKEQENETVWEKYLRERKEKKKKTRKELKKREEEARAKAKPTAEERTKEKEAEEKQRAELDLLMVAEDVADKKKGFTLEKIVDPETLKRKRKRTKIRKGTGDEEPDTFRINTDDPRFADLFLKKDFEIDPTSSQFKKTPAMQALLEEKRRRHLEWEKALEKEAAEKVSHAREGKKPESDITHLVESVKRKAQQFSAAKDSKLKRTKL